MSSLSRLLPSTLLLTAVVLLAAPLAHAQQQSGRLTGRVVTEDAGEPLVGATVALWTETAGDSTLVAGTATGPDGTFALKDVPIADYVLRVSFVGYANRRFPDTRPATGEAADLGTIRLRSEATRAGEVEVMADRPAVRMETDRNVYDTAGQTLTAGGSARSVLESLPSIRIDMDGSISFRGSESVSLHINGEPASLSGQSLLGFLESLPANAIKRVETIPNPSAKYEPTGMAGIINIVLRHDLEAGWNGGVTLGSERDAEGRWGGNVSGNTGYQSGGWRLSATYSHRRDSEEDVDARLLEQLNGAGPNRQTEQSGREEEQDRSHSLNTQAEYHFSANTSLDVQTTVSYRGDEERGRTEYWEYRGAAVPDNQQDRYARLTDSERRDRSFDGRLGFDHDFFGEGHTLSTQLRYDREFEAEDGVYQVFGYAGDALRADPRARELETVNEDEQDGSLKIDYERPLGDFDLEAGYKGSLRRLNNDQTFEGETTLFTFDERIHAAYGTLSRGLGDVFSAEAGLRAETVGTTFDLSGEGKSESAYVSLYPSAFLIYNPSPRRQARLSYSKRVDRPNLWHISPLEDNEDPTFRREGNPGLDPEYIHSFELSATQRWGFGSVTVTPYVRHTVNEIDRVPRQETTEDGESVIVLRPENLSTSTAYGTELVGTYSVGERLQGRINGSVYRSVTDGSNLTTDRSQDAILYSGRANMKVKLREGLQLEMSQFYRPAREIPPQGRIDPFSSTEMGLRQQLFGGSGSLTLRVDDLFNQTEMNIWYRDQDIYQQSRFQWGSREFSLSFQYTFGSRPEGEGQRGRRGRR